MINSPGKLRSSVGVKQPKILKVIRKVEPATNGMGPWWSMAPKDDRYYSSMLNDKQYIYSFLTPASAENCLSFLKKFKEVNKRYPDLSDERLKIRKPNQSDFNIYIQDETIWSLKERCLCNNIGLVGITFFEYTYVDSFLGQKNVFNLSISAIDLLENESLDKEGQIEHFNYLLDI
jgi:hypothetical protein